MLSLILLQQIAQLFIIIFLGWAIVKAGILKSEDVVYCPCCCCMSSSPA